MKTVKKVLAHIFVIAVNFYLLSFFIGLFLMLYTAFAGPLNIWISLAFLVALAAISISYQATRSQWKFLTIGETIINNTNKHNIFVQTSPFSITRIPLFLLILVTLALHSNLQDGLSEGHTYGIGGILFRGLVLSCTYYGLKNFSNKPELLPVFLIAGGLVLVGIAYKYSPKARVTGDLMFQLEMGLAILWIITGIIYKTKIRKGTVETIANI